MKFNLSKIDKVVYMEQLSSFIDSLIIERDSLREQLRSYDLEERVANLLAENTALKYKSLHVLTKSEEEQVIAFKEEHWNKCRGNVSYILTGTGIGTGVELVCNKCATRTNVTDYSTW